MKPLSKIHMTQKPIFCFNPSNAKLNPICHWLALVGAHHILHVSRVRLITHRFMSRWDGLDLLLHTLTWALDRGHLSASRAGRFISGERNPTSQ
jgi:hypothetical protein